MHADVKVYFVSGLAADSRVFKHIRLPEGFETVHLDWIPALSNESLENYAGRLAQKIVPGEPFCLVGLSMGGMMVSEIAKQYSIRHDQGPAMTILLSSVPVHKHLPPQFKLARYLRLHRIIPVRLLKSASLLKRLFSVDSSEDKKILTEVIKDSDPVFIRWAMNAVLEWRNEIVPSPFYHIHGSKDHILPLRYTKPTHIISKGAHLMVMSRAGELNKLIAEALLSVQIKTLNRVKVLPER